MRYQVKVRYQDVSTYDDVYSTLEKDDFVTLFCESKKYSSFKVI